MAYTSGITDSAASLHTILYDFLIAQGWVAERWTGTELIIRGPGGGGPPFWVGISRTAERLFIYGMTGFVTSNALLSQPNISAARHLPLKNKPFRYHIVANARRVIVAAAPGPWYNTIYAGYIIPYATVADFQYPLFIGGRPSASSQFDVAEAQVWWAADNNSNTSRIFRLPGGSWAISEISLAPLFDSLAANHPPLLGGAIQADPIMIYQSSPTKGVYGELDGIYLIHRDHNADRSIITIGGTNFLAFMEGTVGSTNYWGALRLA